MKGFRGFVVTLGVVMAIMAFFPGISAFADGSHSDPQTTASEAASANDRDTMESFVLHAKQHIDDIVAENRSALSTLYKDMRDEGIWRHDPVYTDCFAYGGWYRGKPRQVYQILVWGFTG